jgi:hypothetical protein
MNYWLPARAIQTQAVAAHCVFLSLTQDGWGPTRHSCSKRARLDPERHDVCRGLRHGVNAAPHFRDARPSHSDDPSAASELIGLDTLYSLSYAIPNGALMS